jgi:hypothetical protein
MIKLLDPSLNGDETAAAVIVVDGGTLYYCARSRARNVIARFDPRRDAVMRDGDGPIVVVLDGAALREAS